MIKRFLSFILFCSLCLVCCGINSNEQNSTDVSEQEEEYNEEILSNEDLDKLNEFVAQARKKMDEDKNYSEAVKLFDEAIKIGKKDWIYGDRGRAKVLANDAKGAIEDFTKAIKLNERDVYYEWRASAYGLIGEKQLEKEDLIKVSKIQKKSK
jgi:tetratricopeptide (TPR) repeat protein